MIDSTNVEKCRARITARLEKIQQRLEDAKLDYERRQAEEDIDRVQAVLDEMPVNQKWADLEIERLRTSITANKAHADMCKRQTEAMVRITVAFEKMADVIIDAAAAVERAAGGVGV